MDTGIGPTLREARSRRKVDLSAVEAATKIRLRYLRAMENEEWDALPGDPYTRGFIRTYASYLGLDGERLADEYGRGASAAAEGAPRAEPIAAVRAPRGGPRLTGRGQAGLVALGLAAALVAIGLLGEGGGSSPTSKPDSGTGKAGGDRRGDHPREAASRPGVAVRLTATAEVWVCLLDAAGEPLIDGQILTPGAEEGPFRSGRFTVSFGNGAIEMRIDGKPAEIPATASPLGYEVGGGGELRPLSEAERPTCA